MMDMAHISGLVAAVSARIVPHHGGLFDDVLVFLVGYACS